MKRLFIEDLKGYMETFDNVNKISIKTHNDLLSIYSDLK